VPALGALEAEPLYGDAWTTSWIRVADLQPARRFPRHDCPLPVQPGYMPDADGDNLDVANLDVANHNR